MPDHRRSAGMNPRLPRLTAREVQRVLEKRGFRVVRGKGSRRIRRDSLGRRVTLPHPAGKILHPKIPAMITEDAGLREDDFEEQPCRASLPVQTAPGLAPTSPGASSMVWTCFSDRALQGRGRLHIPRAVVHDQVDGNRRRRFLHVLGSRLPVGVGHRHHPGG